MNSELNRYKALRLLVRVATNNKCGVRADCDFFIKRWPARPVVFLGVCTSEIDKGTLEFYKAAEDRFKVVCKELGVCDLIDKVDVDIIKTLHEVGHFYTLYKSEDNYLWNMQSNIMEQNNIEHYFNSHQEYFNSELDIDGGITYTVKDELSIEKQVEIKLAVNEFHFRAPIELAATQWAVDYFNSHQELIKYIAEMVG